MSMSMSVALASGGAPLLFVVPVEGGGHAGIAEPCFASGAEHAHRLCNVTW
jgi:hypothetical protein